MTDKQQQALDKKAENARELGLDYEPAQQEPVAFKQFLSDVHTAAGLVTHGKQCKALGERLGEGVMRYTATPPAAQPAPVQEPVAWINAEKRTFEWNGPVLWNTPTVAILDKIPLYTTPPAQRQWVGLTADEMEGLYQLATYMDDTDYIHMLMMAEAKLKEKNI
jgi:hypothetical protein